MNSVQLIGRTTKDIELRVTQGGLAVARFTLAINRKDKDKGTDFISCIAFGKVAEVLEKYIHKGNRLGVNGHIQTGSYTKKDGSTAHTTDVIVDAVHFLESNNNSNSGGQSNLYDSFIVNNSIDEAELPF